MKNVSQLYPSVYWIKTQPKLYSTGAEVCE